MGMLRIYTWGSFDRIDRTFSAQKSGHTVAVDDAIGFLRSFKEKARLHDLKLRKDGHAPDDNFAEANARGVLGAQSEQPDEGGREDG